MSIKDILAVIGLLTVVAMGSATLLVLFLAWRSYQRSRPYRDEMQGT